MAQPQYQPCQYGYPPITSNGCNNHTQVPHFNCFQPHYEHTSSHLPHSRSMDQYTEHASISHELFRHSLDHPMANDTVDGQQRYTKPLVAVNQHLSPAPNQQFYNNHLNHYNVSEYPSIAGSNRPTNTNYQSNKISPRNYDQQVMYDNHPNMSYYSGRNYDDDLIKFEDSPKNISKADRSCGHQDPYECNNSEYTDLLRKADGQFNRPRQSYSYASALKQNQHADNTHHLLEQKIRDIDIANGDSMKFSKEYQEERRMAKNRQILAEFEGDDENSRDSRASDFDSTDYAYDEENAKASRNKDGQGSMEEWNYVYNGIKKNSQNNGNIYTDGLRNGNDRVNESKQKSVGKKSKEQRSELSAITKNNTVTNDHKTNKLNKLRATKIEVDEIDLYKNSTVKKQQKNGRHNEKSTVTVAVSDWDCAHCTFINSGTLKICSMCSKSRDFKDKPLPKATATPV